jgi:hypothetical protein
VAPTRPRCAGRRTYIGAPGRIIRASDGGSETRCSCSTRSTRSGWTSGATEFGTSPVLDPEQSTTRSGQLPEVPFDLSKVLFVPTANLLDVRRPSATGWNSPPANYTEQEKIGIGKRSPGPEADHNRPRPSTSDRRRGDDRAGPLVHARGRRPEPRARAGNVAAQGRPAGRRGRKRKTVIDDWPTCSARSARVR